MTDAPATVTTTGESVHCPMCDYDLRGQVEPRCPECGYRFDWEELRDPARRLHPYLFEHHPRRNFWSFRKTLVAGLRPRRFWSTLYPTQLSRPWRLRLYFLIVCLVCLLLLPTQVVRRVLAMRAEIMTYRSMLLRDLQTARGAQSVILRYPGMTPQQIVDRIYPVPAWGLLLDETLKTYKFSNAALALSAPILWVLLTMAALMIFQISMRRARVRSVHILRCIVYSSDVLIWGNLLLAAALVALGFDDLRRGPGSFRAQVNLGLVIAAVTLLALILFVYRLRSALKHYIRMDHPGLTVLATQVIVALTMLVAFVWGTELLRG